MTRIPVPRARDPRSRPRAPVILVIFVQKARSASRVILTRVVTSVVPRQGAVGQPCPWVQGPSAKLALTSPCQTPPPRIKIILLMMRDASGMLPQPAAFLVPKTATGRAHELGIPDPDLARPPSCCFRDQKKHGFAGQCQRSPLPLSPRTPCVLLYM